MGKLSQINPLETNKEAMDVTVDEATRKGWGVPRALLGTFGHVFIYTHTNTTISYCVSSTWRSLQIFSTLLPYPLVLVGPVAGSSKRLEGGKWVRSECSFSWFPPCLCSSGGCNSMPAVIHRDRSCLFPHDISIIILFIYSLVHCSIKCKSQKGRYHVCVFTIISLG